ncbi:hypothetical protein PHAVU_001G258600 [Phaseolus vulgaris]|uniref:Uncharacterized protein n=1 Tax=Phaseolus vulgaris TaxID=3885 RepID=V7D2H9_PHAVU|nr:hypothetical protein PHAVU_001G258600g [Phaseolus vulgaris]ESW35715.1 hypothetical protein PHAVU_001G258600g [Phaseolus vulgaris]
MDSGMSWADQWDNNPDPSPTSNKDKKKNKDEAGKNKFGKTVMNFKWVKELRKKTSNIV